MSSLHRSCPCVQWIITAWHRPVWLVLSHLPAWGFVGWFNPGRCNCIPGDCLGLGKARNSQLEDLFSYIMRQQHVLIHGHLSHQAPDGSTTAIEDARIMQNLAVLCMSEQNVTQMNNGLCSQLAASWCKMLKASDETVLYQQSFGMGFLKV